MPDVFEAELRGDWMRRLPVQFLASNRCLRVLEGRLWIATWAEQAALESRLIWDCGRPR